jgi:predicted cation transporter
MDKLFEVFGIFTTGVVVFYISRLVIGEFNSDVTITNIASGCIGIMAAAIALGYIHRKKNDKI